MPTNSTCLSDWSAGRGTRRPTVTKPILNERGRINASNKTKTSSVQWKECVLQQTSFHVWKKFPTDSGSEQFKMDIRAEQRAVIRFYVRLGKRPGETYADMKKSYDSECLSKTTVNSWHKSYRDGWDIVGLGPHRGMKKLVITKVKQSSRSGLREWRTVFVMMVGTSKRIASEL